MHRASACLLTGLVIGSLVGCGDDEDGASSSASEAEARSSVTSYFRALGQGDGSTACSYLTDSAQEQAHGFSGVSAADCSEALSEGTDAGSPPKLGPVGADDQTAVVMVDFEGFNRYLYVLKRVDGKLLIDFLGPLPEPDGPGTDTGAAEDAKDVANEYVEAAVEQDGKKACALVAPSVLKLSAVVLSRYKGSIPPPLPGTSLREKCEFAISNGLFNVGSFSSSFPSDTGDTRHFSYGVGAGDFAVAVEEDGYRNLSLVRDGNQWLVTGIQVADE